MRACRKSRIRHERNAFFALLGFSLAVLLLPLPYITVTASPKATPVFELVDRNRDGYIDRREADVVPGLAADFDKMDRNADGRLDRVEFARW
jgi:hypothetical protein